MAKVQPFDISCKVEPAKPGETFHLSAGELTLFDSIAQEHVRIIGTTGDYYSQNVVKAKRDPVYDEPVDRKWSGPFRIPIFFEYEGSDPYAEEQGKRQEFPASVWIARKDLDEKGAPSPQEADVVRVWNTPFFNSNAVDDEEVPGAGFFFDIIDVDTDGHLFDNPAFVGFKIQIKRRTEMSPERLVFQK